MHVDAEKWIDKAEGDFQGAKELSKKHSLKFAHLICFACQQSAEKYLKGFLVEHNIVFSKTHDLTMVLLPLCLEVDEEFKVLHKHLKILEPYAVEFRYPGEEISRLNISEALEVATKVRKFVRGKLGLEKQKRLL
ncbi:MAG: HEPN domain-containing protein [Ignavibacteriales bacterium]|nr:HEPN domain-containing protein [Ignavibacteriales bacterium]